MLSIGDFARLGHVSPRMLRHYDDVGLLRPERVDNATGYRSYTVAQLGRLHRVLALRDLGFGLEQIGAVLDDDPPLEQLSGMLRLRRAELAQGLVEDEDRLRRVEAHLRALEGSTQMQTHNIVLKNTDPARVAETIGTAPGFGHQHLGPVFQRLVPKVLAHLERTGARPGIMIAWYEEPADDGSVVVHAGFDIANQAVDDGADVHVTELPEVFVASVMYHGAMEDIEGVYVTLVQWIEDSGYHLAGRSRELYHVWDDDDPTRSVTEIQMPIAK
jgi:DNA-binding transcriptional MerR regulator